MYERGIKAVSMAKVAVIGITLMTSSVCLHPLLVPDILAVQLNKQSWSYHKVSTHYLWMLITIEFD
jgi:hypothetical protein